MFRSTFSPSLTTFLDAFSTFLAGPLFGVRVRYEPVKLSDHSRLVPQPNRPEVLSLNVGLDEVIVSSTFGFRRAGVECPEWSTFTELQENYQPTEDFPSWQECALHYIDGGSWFIELADEFTLENGVTFANMERYQQGSIGQYPHEPFAYICLQEGRYYPNDESCSTRPRDKASCEAGNEFEISTKCKFDAHQLCVPEAYVWQNETCDALSDDPEACEASINCTAAGSLVCVESEAAAAACGQYHNNPGGCDSHLGLSLSDDSDETAADCAFYGDNTQLCLPRGSVYP